MLTDEQGAEVQRLNGELRQERADLARWKADYEALDARVNELANVVQGIRDRHHRRTERHGSGCVSCGRLWPCPDYQDADAALNGGEGQC